ncbi:hypothetical protein [Streptomyces apocyni]|uniref:hypothetical protein n=1 Tax=Streptomyces apocyni TaxID=2654677 RepID=UPI0012EA4B14|nr:hypothetical protein [Streptomyces apocyni]
MDGPACRFSLTGHRLELDEATDGVNPEHGGGQDLTLGGDASISDDWPLIGRGHLRLDGDGDHASTQNPVTATDGSFSLTARVRLDEDSPTRDMAVLTLPGEHRNAVFVRYSAETYSWELAMSHGDTEEAELTTVPLQRRIPHGYGPAPRGRLRRGQGLAGRSPRTAGAST